MAMSKKLHTAQPMYLVDGPDDPNTGQPTVAKFELIGSNVAGESDQVGVGNGTAAFAAPTRYVDVFNGGAEVLEVTAGGVTRYVPPGPRLVAFPTAHSEFAITADGNWIATANA